MLAGVDARHSHQRDRHGEHRDEGGSPPGGRQARQGQVGEEAGAGTVDAAPVVARTHRYGPRRNGATSRAAVFIETGTAMAPARRKGSSYSRATSTRATSLPFGFGGGAGPSMVAFGADSTGTLS